MTETHFAMASEWMVNGNISDFVRAHPDADELELVGFPSKFCRPCFVDNWIII